MIALSIEVRGPSRDLHSGNEGGKHCYYPFQVRCRDLVVNLLLV